MVKNVEESAPSQTDNEDIAFALQDDHHLKVFAGFTALRAGLKKIVGTHCTD